MKYKLNSKICFLIYQLFIGLEKIQNCEISHFIFYSVAKKVRNKLLDKSSEKKKYCYCLIYLYIVLEKECQLFSFLLMLFFSILPEKKDCTCSIFMRRLWVFKQNMLRMAFDLVWTQIACRWKLCVSHLVITQCF